MKNVGGMKLGERDNREKYPKNPDIAHQNYPLATPGLELGTPAGRNGTTRLPLMKSRVQISVATYSYTALH